MSKLELLKYYMSIEVEVRFFDQLSGQEESFIGTSLEIAREVGIRTLLYGSCAYKIITKPSILLDIKEEDE